MGRKRKENSPIKIINPFKVHNTILSYEVLPTTKCESTQKSDTSLIASTPKKKRGRPKDYPYKSRRGTNRTKVPVKFELPKNDIVDDEHFTGGEDYPPKQFKLICNFPEGKRGIQMKSYIMLVRLLKSPSLWSNQNHLFFPQS